MGKTGFRSQENPKTLGADTGTEGKDTRMTRERKMNSREWRKSKGA